MKLGIFADPHYCRAELLCGTRRPRLSLGKMREALAAFQAAEVDLVVCLGDLTDHCETHAEASECLNELMALVNESALPFINVPGNHDYLDFSAEELAEKDLPTPPYVRVIQKVRFIILDANYRADMRRFDIAGVEWTDANLPPEQVEFLKETLSASEEPCVILIHECLDDRVEEHHIIKNAAQIRKILEDSGKTALVFEGHYHPGADRVIHDIHYITVPAMCEGEENRYFIYEI